MVRTSFTLVMLAIAGAMALLIGLAIYGVICYAVSQQRREIGIRIALRARQRESMRIFLTFSARSRRTIPLALIGISRRSSRSVFA
jgi:ABC-type lipoprotein release transport system permease subunit